MAFIDQIRWQCRVSASKPALSVPGTVGAINYSKLGTYLDSVCGRLAALGVRAGASYGLLVDDMLLHIVAMLALEELGATSVSLNSAELSSSWNLAAVLADHEAPGCTAEVIRMHANWFHAGSAYTPRSESARAAVPRVILTSGTTGFSKAVPRSATVLRTRIVQSDYIFGAEFASCTRIMSWLGVNTGLGYVSAIRVLSCGGLFAVPDASVERTAAKINQYRIDAVIASPQALAELAAFCRKRSVKFPSLEVVLSTGSILPKPLADMVREVICSRVVNVYGSTEAGIIATAYTEVLDLENGEVGFVIPGMRVDIVNPENGSRAREGGGKIHIRGETCISGYIDADPKGDAFDQDGFLPGDNGYLSPGGMLSIFGRDGNVVNLGGAKTTIEQIETRILTAPGVKDIAIVLIEDRFGIKRLRAIIVPDERWSEQHFWDHCHRRIAGEYWPEELKITTAIPRGASGKIDRNRVAALVL